MNTLRKNTEGSAVLFLQKKLKPLFPTLNPDGKFGHETHTIVKQFQAQNNLPADGIVGGKTWIALYLKTVNPRDTTGKTDRFNNILHSTLPCDWQR